MTEGQNQGQGQGQQPQQQASPQPQASPQASQQASSQPNADSIARAARLDGEGEGYSKAARELGVSIEEAKAIIQDHQQKVDAEKTAQQRLADKEGDLKSAQAEVESHKKRANRFEKIMTDSVNAQIEQIADEAIKELLSGMDVAGQFGWLQKHGAKYTGAPSPEEAHSSPSQAQRNNQVLLDRLRGPDASQVTDNTGLVDANRQMNDLIRARGLGGS